MDNKKILVSFLLVVLIALSLSAVSAADNGDVLSANQTVKPAANTVDAVQDAINLANETDTVDISNFAEYDFGDKSVSISKSNVIFKGNGTTVIKGHGANAAGKGNALIEVSASNVTIQGITFIDTHPANNFTYNGTVYGSAVRFMGVEGGLLSGCDFTDFSSAAIVQKSHLITLENNNVKGGYTTIIANDPTVNVEKGTKAFNIYGQSDSITIRGNTFEGQQLDGVSIAQGSGANIVENNTFIGNTYGIYFGGSSTTNSVIRGNRFINCGYFKEGDVEWKELPVISIQKASNDIAIENNYFEAINNNILIAAERGNEAHGFPTSLENVNVTGNTVKLYDSTVYPKTVVLFHVLFRTGDINISDSIKVKDNDLYMGVNEMVVWSTEWGPEPQVLIPTGNSSAELQALIDAAKPGDIIDVSNFDSFNFADSCIKLNQTGLTLRGNGNTTIFGFGANNAGKGNALIEVSADNVTIAGINFIDTHPLNNFTYNGTVFGAAVRFMGVTGGLLSGCDFTDFSSAAIVQKSHLITLENNNIKGGYTTIIANDPTVNVEKGTKAFNIYGQSDSITIRGNTFEGQQLDGISIAQGSGANIVENNIFIGNTYGIYFGGSSTKNSVIRNNTFINCGYFKEGEIVWTELPVISIQKASNDIAIVDNTFAALADSVMIAAEQGNEAHGFPSALGNINVTGNTVKLANENVSANNIVLFSIYCRNGQLNISAPINVTGNVLADGVKTVSLQTTGDSYFDIEKNETPVVVKPIATVLSTKNISVVAGSTGKLTVTLKDENGTALANQLLAIEIDGTTFALPVTDANGTATVNVKYNAKATKYAYISFVDTNGTYIASLATAKITVTQKATALVAKAATLKVKKAKKIAVTLKSGKTLLKNKKVTITVNGKTFAAKTNAKGVAKITVKVLKKGKFTATVKFAGDSVYKAVTKKVKYTVK